MPGPLAGLRVIDVSAIVSGPLAAMMLADQGAEVVKIEPPGIGDLMRAGAYRRGGLSAFFANANRGKRGVVVDLGKPRGREVVLEIARGADVFIQNYRPGAMERIGLGEKDLRGVSPDIIYASINGYGDDGPYRDRRVYDPIIQGLTGHAAIQCNPEAPIPDLVRNIVADKASAYTAAQAITAALYAREKGAGGQHVRVPMIDASLAFFWCDGMMKHTLVGEGVVPGPTLYEIYRLTETSDGHLIYFAASNDEIHGVFRSVGREDLSEDPRFATPQARSEGDHFVALGKILYGEFLKHTTADLLARMIEEDVPCGPVHSLEALLQDPQILNNQSYVEREHPTAGVLRQPRVPARFDRTPAEPGRLAPLHGEHTDEVLAEAGFSAEEREALRSEGVIPSP